MSTLNAPVYVDPLLSLPPSSCPPISQSQAMTTEPLVVWITVPRTRKGVYVGAKTSPADNPAGVLEVTLPPPSLK